MSDPERIRKRAVEIAGDVVSDEAWQEALDQARQECRRITCRCSEPEWCGGQKTCADRELPLEDWCVPCTAKALTKRLLEVELYVAKTIDNCDWPNATPEERAVVEFARSLPLASSTEADNERTRNDGH